MKLSAFIAISVSIAACGGGGDGGPTGNNGGPKPVASIQIDGAKSTFIVGESFSYTAIPLDASGNVTSAAAATWESSAPTVASISATGGIQALTVGTTTIKATIGSITATRALTVIDAGSGAIVTMPGLTFAPFTVTIDKGKSVFFDFPVLGHNVIFSQRQGAPANIDVTANVTVTRSFPASGTFPYDCTIHAGMRGEVVVNP